MGRGLEVTARCAASSHEQARHDESDARHAWQIAPEIDRIQPRSAASRKSKKFGSRQ
jgi:hypothetical protein